MILLSQSPKRNKTAVIFSSALFAAIGMAGCGGSTNPTDAYQKVVSQQTVPASQATKPASQLLVSNDFYTITVDKPTDATSTTTTNHDLLFYEGRTNQHTLTVKFLVPNVQYDLIWVEAKQGQITGSTGATPTASLTRSAPSSDTWVLSYAIPEVDLLDNEVEKTFLIHLQIDVSANTDLNSQAVLNKINKVSELEGIELHTTQSPTIQAISGGLDMKTQKSVDENSQTEVLVDVTDPGSGNSVPPVLDFYEGASDNQQKYADGQTLLRFKDANEKPASLGNDKWEYHLVVDAQDAKIDHGHLNYQATFQVLSRSGLKSPAVVTHFTINPAADPAPPPVKPVARKKNPAAKTNDTASKSVAGAGK